MPRIACPKVFASGLFALAAFSAHAGTVSNWTTDGQAAVVNSGAVAQVTGGQSGAVWSPDTLNLSSILSDKTKSTVISFDFQATGSPASSDGFSLILTSGSLGSFSSSAYGLSQFNDGVAFVVAPGANEATSASPGQSASSLAANLGYQPVPVSDVNMLSATSVAARLTFAYSSIYNSWTASLDLNSTPANTASWVEVALAQISVGSFASPSLVNLGLGASTLQSPQSTISFSNFSETSSTVPEPGVAALIASGALVLLARRRLSHV